MSALNHYIDHFLENEQTKEQSVPRVVFEAALQYASIERSRPRHDPSLGPRKLAVHAQKLPDRPHKYSNSAKPHQLATK